MSTKDFLRIAGVALSLLGTVVLAYEPWMVPNGDFRHSGEQLGLLQNWKIYAGAGNEARTTDIPCTWHESRTLYLKKTNAERVVVYQTLQLPPGQYRLNVELTPGSANALVSVSENPAVILDSSERAAHSVNLDFASGGDVILHMEPADVGDIGIVRVALERLANPVVPVPCADGKSLGRIVLPLNPTIAERFAAWEALQLCWQTTGATPEICHVPSEGNDILIGHAATLKTAAAAPDDTYLYGLDENGDLNLTGSNDRGTLYAVYRFFNSQGCSWILPGREGATIPKLKELSLPDEVVSQSPRYEVRGYMLDFQIFHISKHWELFPYEDICDWFLRNGMNAFWAAGEVTYEMGDWRGGCFMQRLNHSWYKFLLDDHPEWWPLVNGKRVKMHPSGLPNQPCISNPELRDYAVDMICQFFKEHPEYNRYPLNAEDEPCYWCECENCTALDAPHGNEEVFPKTDRSLNFVNEVARRVAARCPGKTIELYGYGSNREPPQREKLDPNVVYKWCFHLRNEPRALDSWVVEKLSAWREQGGLNRLAIYDYDNYLYPDAIWSGLRYSFESLIDLNEQFGAVEYLPESEGSIQSNPLLYQLRRDALWGAKKEDFEELVKKHCREFFGGAAEVMTEYIMAMDRAFLKGQSELESRPVKDKNVVYLPQLTMTDLLQADAWLDKAEQLAENDAVLTRRIAGVRFGHEMTKVSLLTNLTAPSFAEIQAAAAGYRHAKELVNRFDLLLMNQMSISQLAFFYMPPLIEKTVAELPLEWRFCTDPENKGQEEEWFKVAHADWKPIMVDKDWTAQGYDYHGIGWYELDFDVNEDLADDLLAFHFGAVDGIAYIYLDGELIGDQLEAPEKMWELPFAIKCSALSQGSHRLNVRVEKKMWAAGIWKPVSLVILQNRKVEVDSTPNK